MEYSLSPEAHSSSANQETPCISCSPKVHYRVHKSPPLGSDLWRLNPVHSIPSYFFKTHCNIKLLSTPLSSKWSLLLQVSPPKACMYFSSTPCMRHAQQVSSCFIFVTQTIFGEQYRSWSSSLCSFLQSGLLLRNSCINLLKPSGNFTYDQVQH
jgi:hypothetical protein